MNYLAHILLSGKDPQKQLGNFIGDAVKGHAYEKFPSRIREGILLHRAIDDFADRHALVKEAVYLTRASFGRYAAVLVDMYFDYFLATEFRTYAGRSLSGFAFRFYGTAVCYYRYLPPRFQGFLWHFILTNRLCKYASLGGLQRSLEIMVRYKNLRIDAPAAIGFLCEKREELEVLFQRFFPEIRDFCDIS